jgi:lipoyl(octanoyl) transferase
MEKWRLVVSPPLNGPLNMATDEAILQTILKNGSSPVLRLFAWDPACLSLGFAQPFADIDETALNERGWDFVRRPTGGRAILHVDELTYSVSASLACPVVQGSILESYRRLSGGLLKALEILGLQAIADKEYGSTRVQPNQPVCFEVPSNYEITVQGKKLIGSAQSRKSGGVLQHGTLPLFGDIGRINNVLKYPDKQSMDSARSRIYSHATTLEEVLHRKVNWEEAAHAYVRGFETALGISLIESSLTDEENELADQLLNSKYRTREWNCK